MEDEDPASKQALSSFHGAVVNQIKCGVCGTVSSNKEGFYDLAVPLPASGKAHFSLFQRVDFNLVRGRNCG
jgi:hypothetical protein